MTPKPIAEIDCDKVTVKTMADGSPRFQFDGGEAAIPALSKVAKAWNASGWLHVLIFDGEEWKDYLDDQLTIG